MRVAALISGGKDSCYNMMQCIAEGHQIVALANLRPDENQVESDELDSYMYQTVGHHAIDLYAEAMALPLYRRTIRGRSLETGRVYTQREGDEVEDLYELLKLVKEKEEIEGVSVGAILSDYQRGRVENVCKRLNLQPLAYLWQRNQEDLLREMIASNIKAIIIKVAALVPTGLEFTFSIWEFLSITMPLVPGVNLHIPLGRKSMLLVTSIFFLQTLYTFLSLSPFWLSLEDAHDPLLGNKREIVPETLFSLLSNFDN
ncbi:diphthine--ammonia ligase isoform X2 [Mus caroli]|uniref:Diphthine--ammonia ligase n=1 Tax=Mus caroli TaxID=10089 RepID=A0A6P7QML0_MUSCR|nr:diphthine--ammonia ligase isoform X2 [Mus caroli]